MLGNKSIDSIKPSDAKEWAIRMKENSYAYQTINNYKRSLLYAHASIDGVKSKMMSLIA